MTIDLKSLPREVRDRLELKEQSDPTFERALEEDYTDIFHDMLDERKKPGIEQNYLASIYGTQGSGKSMGGIYICGTLYPKFSAENIYFDYNKLVNERYKLKPHTAVLIDEQSTPYGVDSNRIVIILNALKESLRKRSVHMIYASPTLKAEYLTSMYVLESMFIDHEFKESYFAYKTSQLQSLGYVVIPHPLKVVSKKTLLDYEKLKDEYLDQLVTQPIDDVEVRAKLICDSPAFKKAEDVYIKKLGYIPTRTLVQLISQMFPEFKGSVIVYELADRIRLNKEMCADGFEPGWEIAGKSAKKKEDDKDDPDAPRHKKSIKEDVMSLNKGRRRKI